METPNMETPNGDKLLPISILAAAVVIGGAILFSVFYRPSAGAPPAPGAGAGTAPTSTAAAPGVPSAAAVAAALALTPRDVALGNASATVTVVEYGDYQCPFCTRYFEQIEPILIQNYVNPGKIKLVFRDFPFLDRFPGLPAGSNESHVAGAAAECAKDQNKFWQYHDALYTAKSADEAKGGGENDGLFTPAFLTSLAGKEGMNTATFSSCLTSGKYTAAVNADYANAVAAGVDSTPTTFVNGVMVTDTSGNSVGADLSAITAAIDAALAK